VRRAIAALLATALAAGALVTGCDASDKREAGSLVKAMERVHRADNAGKPAAVDALREVRCSADDVCRARTACLVSGEAIARALRLRAEVGAGIAELDAGTLVASSEKAKALPLKLAEAESLLAEGNRLLPGCDDQLMALRRKHQL